MVVQAPSLTQCPPCHWRIEEQSGPLSVGCCIKCGQRKAFKNFISMPDGSTYVGPLWT